MLTSYFRFAVKNQIAGLLGVRSSRRDSLNGCHSIDEPLTDGDDFTLGDTLLDEAATLDFEEVEQRAYNDALRNELEKGIAYLPENIGFLIRQCYLEGETTEEAAARIGVSEKYAYELRRKGLPLLRQYDRGHGHGRLYAFLHDPAESSTLAYRNTGLCAFRFGGSSVERAAEHTGGKSK